MGFFDALFGNAPKIKMGTQAQVAPQGWQGDYGQMVGAGQAGQMQSREQQASLAQALQAQMAGRGPNLGALQMQQAQNQNIAGTAGQIASARGMSPAAQIRLAAGNQAQLGQQAALSSAQLTQQQQLAAQQQLAQALQAQRGQDISGMQGAGQLASAQNQLNAQNFNSAQGLNAQMGMAQAQAEQQANQASMLGLGGLLGGLGGAATGLGLVGGKRMSAGGEVAVDSGGSRPGSHKMQDDPEADTEPAMLSPGELVIPRSLGRDPGKIADFVRALEEIDAGKAKPGKLDPQSFAAALKAKMAEHQQRADGLRRALAYGGYR